MAVWYKAGVIGDLQPVARKGLGRIAKLFETEDHDLFITSLRDGNHAAGSLHYDGLAFDMRDDPKFQLIEFRETLGYDWDVVSEKDH
ncbi:MAG: hypothetical protein MIO92_09810, partial [Methanosarcinaceae archaeon]|nr:hypothetical protein [Methanosarcinaceae archaeon]